MKNIFILLFLILNLPGISQISRGGKPYEYKGLKKSSSYQIDIPDKEIQILKSLQDNESQAGKKVLKYAYTINTDFSPENNGEWINVSEAIRVWRIELQSKGAYALGLLFNEFKLNPGCMLFIYDPQQENVLGGFNELNNKTSGILPTAIIPGDRIVVELQVPVGIDYGHLKIASLSHAFIDIFGLHDSETTGIGASGSCNKDVNCEYGTDWQIIKRAVCRVQITSTGEFCSGTLLNNSAIDGKAFLLTANHCIDRNSKAQSAVFYFNFETDFCGDTATIKILKTLSSARLLATSDSLDFSLLLLSDDPPENYEPYFAGWSRDVSPSSKATCIHHPLGDLKKISVENDPVSLSYQSANAPDWLFEDEIPGAYWRIVRWDVATTEPGSSGSPLFNSNQLVIGNLSGGDATCTNPVNDYYAKISVDWDYYQDTTQQLAHWLDPEQLNLSFLSGFDPYYKGEPTYYDRFLVYPNPADDYFILSTDSLSLRNSFMNLYNLQGALVGSYSPNEEKEALFYVSHLKPGVYILKIQIGDILGRKKIIISR
jgi:lysyl endopeptidase